MNVRLPKIEQLLAQEKLHEAKGHGHRYENRRQTALAPTDVLYARCPVCEREAETIIRAQAVELLMLAGQSLKALLSGRRVRTVEVSDDELRVCKDSLVKE